MKVVLSSRTQCVLLSFILCVRVVHGTEPVPQTLPCTLDFSNWDKSSTNYPPGIVGWRIGTYSRTTFILTPATADLPVLAPSSASSSTGGFHNYDGKAGFLDTSNGAQAIACALSTTGRMNIKVAFDIMTLRNPFNGTTNTRTNECGLFYRIGTVGDFTFAGISYTNTATQQLTGTTPQNPQTLTVQLPSSCNAQAVVQLRWSARDLTGSGYRPSFALSRIQVESDPAPLLLAPPKNIRVTSSSPTRLDVVWDPMLGATAYSLDLYACSGPTLPSLLQEDFQGFDGERNDNLQDQLDDYTHTNGWSGGTVYESQGSVRLGNADTRGWLQTPLLVYTGKCSFAFDARAWDYTDEATTIDAYCVQGETTNILETLCLSKTNMQSYIIRTEIAGAYCFGLTAKKNNNNRFFLDNLCLSPGWQTPVTNNMIVTETRACFQGLRPGGLYKGFIRSINGSEQSVNSPEFSAKTTSATLILLN